MSFEMLLPWEPSVTLIAIAIITIFVYVRGCNRVRTSAWQKILFAVGYALLYIVSQTQFDYYAEHEFFMHRLQHSVLHHIGPMLIILSQPLAALSVGLPSNTRDLVKKFVRSRFASFLMNPVLVTSLFIGSIYFWLIPPVHFIAMLDWRVYRVMNWGMALNGLMFWGLALGPSYRPKPLSTAVRIAMMLVVIPAQIILGAVIFYASHDLYPLYALCGRAFGGIGAMADQQIGGLILWIMGSMMSVIGILIVACREFTNLGRRPATPNSLLL